MIHVSIGCSLFPGHIAFDLFVIRMYMNTCIANPLSEVGSYIYIYICISVYVCVMQTWFLHPMYEKIYRVACYDFLYTQHIQPVMSKVQSVHSTICNVSKTNFLYLKSRKTAMMYLDFLGYPLSVPSSSKVRYSYIYGTWSMSELPALTLPPNVWATATKKLHPFPTTVRVTL